MIKHSCLSALARGAALAFALAASNAALAADKSTPSYSVIGRIAGADGGWDFANVDPGSGRLYVARIDAVMAVDLASGAVTAKLAPAQHAHQVLVLTGGKELLETDGDTNLARFIDAMDGTVRAEVAVGIKPDAAVLDPATGLVAVMNAGDGTISLLDPKTRTLAGTIDVGGGLEFGAVDGDGKLFVNIEDRNEIVTIDLRTRAITSHIALAGCEGPTGLTLVAGGKRLISACANGVAKVVDPSAGKIMSTIAIGTDPDAVLYDAKRGLAFIPCGGNGVLEIIADAKPEAIRSLGHVSTAVSAKTAALDPRTGKIYLPSAHLLPPAPGAKRGQPEAGTFAVVVVAPSH